MHSDLTGKALRDETGNLRPIVKQGSRALEAGLGHATGIPGMEAAGVFYGPGLVDAIVPSREPTFGKAEPIRSSPYFNADAYNAGRARAGLNAPMPTGNESPFDTSARSQVSAPQTGAASKGRPATWTNERVLQLASWGDPRHSNKLGSAA